MYSVRITGETNNDTCRSMNKEGTVFPITLAQWMCAILQKLSNIKAAFSITSKEVSFVNLVKHATPLKENIFCLAGQKVKYHTYKIIPVIPNITQWCPIYIFFSADIKLVFNQHPKKRERELVHVQYKGGDSTLKVVGGGGEVYIILED